MPKTLIDLSGVTLACVDTVNPELAIWAMQRCQKQMHFGRSILFTNRLVTTSGIDVIQVNDINDIRSYSRFVLKDLYSYVNSSHVLIVQWDGFIINPELWRDDFLNYDYIGATWPANHKHPEIVGNGGFSLRSRKLLKILQQVQFTDYFPEDEQVARVHRAELEAAGIRFAPPEVGDLFAYEFKQLQMPSFGFHGFSNFPDFMSPDELNDFITAMPVGLMFNNYFLEFVRKIISKTVDEPTKSNLWQSMNQKIAQEIQRATISQLTSIQSKHLISGFCRMKLGSVARNLATARLGASFNFSNLRLFCKALITL